MSRKNLPLALVAVLFVIALAGSVYAAQAPAPAVQPSPAVQPVPASATPDAMTPAQVADPGQCQPALSFLPEPVLMKGTQTCDECLAYCEERELFCEQHCSGRDCGVKCPNQYFQCVAGCPC